MSKIFCLFIGFTVVLLFLYPTDVKSQVVINEFLASNTGAFVDPDSLKNGDWIELYNGGTKTVNLEGYYLTDNFKNTKKYKIPVGIQIQAGGYLLFWADGYDAGVHTSFGLSASGEELGLSLPTGVMIDSIAFGAQEPNISMGRNSSGSAQWVFFTEPTPGIANSTSEFEGVVKSVPDFSIAGGVFNKSVLLKLGTIYGGDVRYTLDGSAPDEQSLLAKAPINITKNTVVRARIYKTGQVLGPIVTNSYFIDTNNLLTDLPIVSIASDPKNFWDPTIGIYTVHSTKPDWEIPINIELFEKDSRDNAAFNLPAGAKSTGLYSWQLPEKMLGISFRKEYGASKLEYPLIFDKARKVYDTFSLRASGSDWGNTMFRDGLTQTAAVENTTIDNSGFRACVVFINGEYMGIHNIREKIDEDYVVGNHGLDGGTFDMVEETDQGHYAEVGDLIANDRFLSLSAKDLTNQSNYDALAAEMDIEEFTEMVCTEVYSGNSSIGHNLMKWKAKDSGKWKWILMDLDRGFSGVNNEMINFYINEDGWPFKELMKNQDYKKLFGRKLADLLFTTFNPDRMISRIDAHKKTIEAEMPNHIKRWEGTRGAGNYSSITAISSMDYWFSEIEKLKAFAIARPDVILNDLTNYGFQSSVPIEVTTSPENSGFLTFNGLKVPVDVCGGGYPNGEEIKLTAEAKAGYKFMGWKTNGDSTFIAKEQIWKFSDAGTDLGTTWKDLNFSDASWKSGQAELGYGDDDEKTVIGFGGDTQHRYITSYFRKSFTLNNKQNVTGLTLLLKCDDGAVVYLNGNEIQRFNMPAGGIDFGTTASTSISGADESIYNSYSIMPDFLVNGNNVIAVEVHQNTATSSDVSFELELSAHMTGTGQYLSTNKQLSVTLKSEFNVSAIFESDGKCILPEVITDALTLNKACSPYVTSRDVSITTTGKLTIEPGVEIWMSDGASIYSAGSITAKGTKAQPIIFRGNPERSTKKWGIISISNAIDTSRFSNVIIEDASNGTLPREVAAITTYNTKIKIDSITFDNIYANPIATSYSYVSVTNSNFHSNIIGDMVNVTRGKGYIANCEFVGNYLPDNDAIDFNGGKDGIVKDCIFRDFFGINNDAIDLGEKAANVKLDGLYVHDITDKGVSIGQQSSALISNSLFTNCNLGAGVKDSSRTTIDHCTFYSVGTPVATYEKIVGRAGGNVKVTNSILSNSYEASYLCDEYSTIDISYSSSDNDRLPDGKNNLFVNPQFKNPTFFDFSLMKGSSCIGAGLLGNMGSGLTDTGIEPEILISDIAYFTELAVEGVEFIGLYNPGNSRVDMSGYQFISGIVFTFPAGTFIGPKQKVYVTSNATALLWQDKGADVYQWESGKLADEGEDIQLTNEVFTMIDEVDYNNKAPWPLPVDGTEAISLSSFDVDNHFGENWKVVLMKDIVGVKDWANTNRLKVYPNPTSGNITIEGLDPEYRLIEVYNISGNKVQSQSINSRTINLNLSNLQQGVYILKSGASTKRIILTK